MCRVHRATYGVIVCCKTLAAVSTKRVRRRPPKIGKVVIRNHAGNDKD